MLFLTILFKIFKGHECHDYIIFTNLKNILLNQSSSIEVTRQSITHLVSTYQMNN
jgi:hypothetical protein